MEKLDTKKNIIIKSARVHNLKNIDLVLPRNKFIVFTGLSGSGKSSLAFDTLYAEGQRRYVESISVYARQFLGKMNKPEVEYIKGLSPAIAISQKINTRNPRSTVGTSTEIYEYLKLLYARIGKTISPISKNEVKRDSVSDVVFFIISLESSIKAMVMVLIKKKKNRTLEEDLAILLQQGYQRIFVKNNTYRISDVLDNKTPITHKKDVFVVVDRFVITNNIDTSRIADSVQTCFNESNGECFVAIADSKGKYTIKSFSNRYEYDGISFEEPTTNFFSFNNPYGACKNCEGLGCIVGIDEDIVVPNKNLSVFDDAIVCWKGEKMKEWKEQLVMNAHKNNFPIHRPYCELTQEEKKLLWNGDMSFGGINSFFKWVKEQQYKIQYSVMLARYRGKIICPECNGTRLRKDANFVKINNVSISDIVLMPIEKSLYFFKNTFFTDFEKKVSKRILTEIINRMEFLMNVGLGYLTLNRMSSSLSGGESQRINLATLLGSNLIDTMYILDEPSIGLHSRDTQRLITILRQLQKNGNTVIVVEHDEEIIKASDHIVDIGPLAGIQGGEIVFQGTFSEMITKSNGLTAEYLNKKKKIKIPCKRRLWKEYIEVIGATENNLKNIHVKFPLQIMTVVTGVSGSGKTSLVKNILYSALQKILGGHREKQGKYIKLNGDVDRICVVEMIDQNPIGRSSRSNPVTYIKAYDDIRLLFSEQQLSKVRGYKPGYFSFNVAGGRCEECEGEGIIKVEMQFMADIYLLCENCNGMKFKQEVLDVKYKEKNINEVLNMTVDEALVFFEKDKKILSKLQPLSDVGLGYIKLGQASSTLSGGEAQRIKLAYFLIKGVTKELTMFIFDEPTIGLHFHDINKLNYAFNALLEKGHTIIIIEHNAEIIKSADWIIDLGPEGGEDGGYVVFEGTPEELIKCNQSYTGKFLTGKFSSTE